MADERWLNEDEARAWRRYVTMQNQLQRALTRQLQLESGLSDADYEVLVNLSEAPEGRLRVYELADSMQWDSSRLSHHLTRMTKRGLLRREVCPTDSRGAFMVLTEAGWDAITEAAPGHVDSVRRWFVDVLTPEQLDSLSEIAQVVLDRLAADGAYRDSRRSD